MTSKITAPNKGLTKFIAMNGTPSGIVHRGKIHGGENVKTVKAKDLSLSQVKTLHRLRGGTEYKMRADLKKGGEVTNQSVALLYAPSIPVLYRSGLVEFMKGRPTASADQGKFFQVGLTSRGWNVLQEFDKTMGRK